MADCTHRMVAEYLTAKRRRPIPALHRPLGWHPGVFKLVCVTCGELMPLGAASDTPETAVEVEAAELAQAVRDEEHGVGEWARWTDEENDGWQAHKHDWPVVPGCEAGWLAREIWTNEEADRD